MRGIVRGRKCFRPGVNTVTGHYWEQWVMNVKMEKQWGSLNSDIWINTRDLWSVMVTLQLWWLLPRSAALTFPDTVFIPLFNYLILVRDSLGSWWWSAESYRQTLHCQISEQHHTCSVTVTPTRVPPIPGHVSHVSNSRLSLSLSPSNSPTITPAVDRSQSVRGIGDKSSSGRGNESDINTIRPFQC